MKDGAASHEVRVLMRDIGMGESPRWHDGRLWFSNWGTDQIVAVDLDGTSEVMGAGGGGSGWAVDWLADGRMLVTGPELVRVEPDRSRVRHADLGRCLPYGCSEITVDGRGNVYVNSINFDFADFEAVMAQWQVPPARSPWCADGTVREVTSGLAFPNGMVVTPDNETLIVAESFARQLTAFDIGADGSLSQPASVGRESPVTGSSGAEGAVWCSDVGPGDTGVVQRVREGGEVDRHGSSSTAPATRACSARGRRSDAVHGRRRVVRPGPDGRAHRGEDGPGPGDTGRHAPRGLAVTKPDRACRRTRSAITPK